MKKLILTALAALTAAASAPAMADRWYAIHLGDLQWWFVNLDSIKCKNDVCTAWQGQVTIDPDFSHDTALWRYQVDCIEGKTKPVFMVKYLSGERTGQRNMDWDWTYAVPGSVDDKKINVTCYPDSRKEDRILLLDKPLQHDSDRIRDAMRKSLEKESKK